MNATTVDQASLGSNSTSNATSQCDIDAFDSATTVLGLFPIALGWWLLAIPQIFKHGFRTYFNGAICQCLRLIFPTVAGIFALVDGDHPSE